MARETDRRYAPPVRGRRPLISSDGEELVKVGIKIYPSQLEWLNRNGGASAWVRANVDRQRRRE